MTAPLCPECGRPWSVETPPTQRYPLGRIMHYCGSGVRYVGRDPSSWEERQHVWLSVLESSRGVMPRVADYLDALCALMVELQPSGLVRDLGHMADRVWSRWSQLTALECRVASERFREWRGLFDVGDGPIVQLDNLNPVTRTGGEVETRSEEQSKRED